MCECLYENAYFLCVCAAVRSLVCVLSRLCAALAQLSLARHQATTDDGHRLGLFVGRSGLDATPRPRRAAPPPYLLWHAAHGPAAATWHHSNRPPAWRGGRLPQLVDRSTRLQDHPLPSPLRIAASLASNIFVYVCIFLYFGIFWYILKIWTILEILGLAIEA